jgi:hypothetical protein
MTQNSQFAKRAKLTIKMDENLMKFDDSSLCQQRSIYSNVSFSFSNTRFHFSHSSFSICNKNITIKDDKADNSKNLIDNAKKDDCIRENDEFDFVLYKTTFFKAKDSSDQQVIFKVFV